MGAEREAVEALSRAWDREPDSVWEPWAPAVGQRVRYVRHLECPLEVGMIPDGALGIVYWVEDPVSENGICPAHRFWVDWENGRTTYTAACEMIPLADADDEMPSGCSTAGQQRPETPAQVSTAPDGDSGAVSG